MFERIKATPLHPDFAAEIEGVDIAAGVDDATFAEVEAAFDEYSVLVFPNQQIGDEEQIAFSRRFGDLEAMLKGQNAGERTELVHLGNIDPATDQIIAGDDARMRRQYSNELWHTDSSFKRIGAKASLLHGRETPPEGGETSFVSMRAAYDALSPEKQAELEKLAAEHWFVWSRSLTVKEDFLTEEQKAQTPPVPQSLVVQNPRNGRKAIYMASHAYRVLGWPLEKSRQFLDELQAHATQDRFAYHHKWRRWDLVMWDNRATQHRGNPFDFRTHRRVMVRATVAGDAPTITAEEAARREAATAATAA